MSALIAFLLMSFASMLVSASLVALAWLRGFGDREVSVSATHICVAVVLLIAAGENAWPAFTLVAAWLSVASAVIAVPVGEQHRRRALSWEAFERELGFYAATCSQERP